MARDVQFCQKGKSQVLKDGTSACGINKSRCIIEISSKPWCGHLQKFNELHNYLYMWISVWMH